MKDKTKGILIGLLVGVGSTVIGGIINSYFIPGLLSSQLLSFFLILGIIVTLGELGAYFFWKKYGNASFWALMIAVVVAFSSFVIFAPRITYYTAYSPAILISSSSSSQQFTTIQYNSYPSPTVPISSSLLVERMYWDTLSLHNQIFANITFPNSLQYSGSPMYLQVSASPSSYIHDTLGLHIFVIDPSGLIRGTYPAGDSPILTIVSNGLVTNTTGFALNPTSIVLNSSCLSVFKSGGLDFSFNVPNSDLSVGTWTVYAFVQNETGIYSISNGYIINYYGSYSSYYSQALGRILAGAASSFQVVRASTSRNITILNWIWPFVTFLGPLGVTYGITQKVFQKRLGKVQLKRWLRLNWTIVGGLLAFVALGLLYMIAS